MAEQRERVKWTHDQEILLIDCVRDRKCLWDIKHEHYHLRNLKRSMYEQISEILKDAHPASADLFTVDEVINKFSNLRTYFKKENKKYKLPSGSGGIGFVPRWEHFFRLQFLEETMEPTPSFSNLDIQNAGNDTSESEDSFLQEHVSDKENLSQSVSNNIPKEPKKGTKRKSINISEIALQTLSEIQNKSEDEEELYGQYIAKVLKSFDPVQRDLCKIEFDKIIFRLRHNIDV